jgi:glycosyltransferase involved in cell wall biosynthesis
MKEKKIYLDISQFISHPYKTGIQRVLYELLINWDITTPLIPLFIDDKMQAHILPPKVLDLIKLYFRLDDQKIQTITSKIKSFTKIKHPLEFTNDYNFAILNPELFYNQNRINFYKNFIQTRGPDQLYFIIYDLLPFIHPEYFPRNILTGCTPYLTLIINLTNCAFISEKTKRDFINRAARTDNLLTCPILPLGSDTLGIHKKSFDPSNSTFTVVGDIRPRKNTEKIMSVFEEIWDKGTKVKLQLCGPINWPDQSMKNRIDNLKTKQSLFSWIDSPSDQILRNAIINSRCTIYASENEGFGLPPLESLSLGTPVIVGNHIPSIELIPEQGMIKIEEITSETLSLAIKKMTDNTFASEKYYQLDNLVLPKWRDLSKKTKTWLFNDAISNKNQA